ncbi:MAG: FecR domain-containing protein [Magnetococcales bacterium]|nr:FecR domain-containing protein [Magnetococcales bacterium]
MPRISKHGIALGLGALLLAPLAAQAADGMVKTSAGAAYIHRQGAKLPAQVGVALDAKDILETGADGAVGITMQDNSRFSLGPNSRFVVEDFAFDPHQNRLAFVGRVESGTLSFNSGDIGKLAPDRVRLTTPLGTIGLRGTALLIQVPNR